MTRSTCAVIGGGILGAAVAHRLTEVGAFDQVTVLEKEPQLAQHQTGRNSGVVHAGLYYTPGSLKAKLCRRGVGMLREFCAEHGIAYDEIGKVLVAGGGKITEDGQTSVPTRTATVVDVNGAGTSVRPTGSMSVGRRQFSLTGLADGSVLATGCVVNPTPTISALALRAAAYIRDNFQSLSTTTRSLAA